MSKVSFCRSISFDATHHYQVPSYSEVENQNAFGDAAKPHSHEWTLTVWLQGTLDPVTGMVVDLVAVDEALKALTSPFEGRSFRDVDTFFVEHQPTTEVLACYFAERIQARFPDHTLRRLRMAEMPSLFAEWEP